MSYFAASLSQLTDGWAAVDLDLDAVESLEDLVDLAIEAHEADDADEPDPAATVVLVEQEDEWFAVVRADPDDPRVFVSDAPAALRHALGEILLPDLVPDVDLADVDVLAPSAAATAAATVPDDLEVRSAADIVAETEPAAAAPSVGLHDSAGDPDLLADLGVPAARLRPLAGPDGPGTAEALTRVAELLGCADALESIR